MVLTIPRTKLDNFYNMYGCLNAYWKRRGIYYIPQTRRS
jgi:hypothetical protein